MDFFIKDGVLNIVSGLKTTIYFDICSNDIKIGDLDIKYPWEYEKWWILSQVMEFEEKLFYSFSIEWTHLVIISSDKFSQTEKILSFFGDVDVLVIVWSKESAKIFENIEARIVIPYWEWKQMFLSTLWQNIQEVNSYKLRWDLPEDNAEFINLA